MTAVLLFAVRVALAAAYLAIAVVDNATARDLALPYAIVVLIVVLLDWIVVLLDWVPVVRRLEELRRES
jgi:hypothetical protein